MTSAALRASHIAAKARVLAILAVQVANLFLAFSASVISPLMSYEMSLTFSLLGLSAMRSAEKFKGKAPENMRRTQ